MALRFYNTLTQRIEDFTPQQGNVVRMYTCGPTVWNYAHIGNLRTFTFVDILRRWLRCRGYQLDHVMNITDVDDRIIQQAMAAGKSLSEYTDVYTRAFLEDAETLRLERPEHLVKATEHIQDMAEAIKRLSEKGYTYESDGSIYFRIANFPEYGKLSHTDFSGIRAGARVDTDRYDKENARDFALWKAPKEGEPSWQTVIGPGRPGWHIECSVMAMKYLGETLDIHGGGIDLTFPHHENEIAQSEALTGKPFARYWLHSEHLIVEGQTMSKSLGNFFTLRDLLERGHAPEAVRYLLASVPYRKKLNFTMDSLRSAETAIERLRNFKLRLDTGSFPEGTSEALLERTRQANASFEEALDDDLNTAEALAAAFEFVRDANSAMDAGQFLAGNTAPALDFLARFDSVFDVLRPSRKDTGLSDSEIEKLIAERDRARKARQFARSDEIRSYLLERGVILEDTKEGTRWRRK
ncbi:MAG TPA: cysteine--tRNA ligase [Bryobacteraceae bacterium]|nr:cysteine--tRNA ligase [Bryobacteraceae bacterium]HOL71532.1 cysteine--tRNA ligase [Bryobacteraceae bacterium]HOQ45324.1 cysteine--tRNA ligase [Bryobacteraceae bacterium]HPQ17558.1 cysteine--tRNA ligase [Bryobacteraceae bacterium]HPU71365.1 cysteine--tRNA ligase [Bryobacteraceae bacterium]